MDSSAARALTLLRFLADGHRQRGRSCAADRRRSAPHRGDMATAELRHLGGRSRPPLPPAVANDALSLGARLAEHDPKPNAATPARSQAQTHIRRFGRPFGRMSSASRRIVLWPTGRPQARHRHRLAVVHARAPPEVRTAMLDRRRGDARQTGRPVRDGFPTNRSRLPGQAPALGLPGRRLLWRRAFCLSTLAAAEFYFRLAGGACPNRARRSPQRAAPLPARSRGRRSSAGEANQRSGILATSPRCCSNVATCSWPRCRPSRRRAANSPSSSTAAPVRRPRQEPDLELRGVHHRDRSAAGGPSVRR